MATALVLHLPPFEKGASMDLADVFVLLGIVAAVAVGVLYAYFADRMVSGR
jgi:hypothetical protein